MSAARRESLKAGPAYGQYQQKRRAAALDKQRASRDARLHLARVLAIERLADERDEGRGEAGSSSGGGGGAWDADMSLDGGPAGSRAAGGAGVSAGAGGRSGAWGGPLPDGAEGLSGTELRQHFARQLMLPEWLTDVPPDLAEGWLVMPRPEGRRCLVVAAHGWTAIRSRTGALLARFRSGLPGGGRRGGGGGGDYTVLDAVLVEPEQRVGPEAERWREQQQQPQQQQQQQHEHTHEHTHKHTREHTHELQQGGDEGQPPPRRGLPPGCALFVSDVLAWRGVPLAGCGAECRAFWLASKLGEGSEHAVEAAGSGAGGASGGDGGGDGCGGGVPEILALPALPATPEGLEAAARGVSSGRALGFVQDGAYLLHREGAYTPGATPLALLWKDTGCSRYLLDTDADGVVPERQQVVLRYRADATVVTADDPPTPLGCLPAAFVAAMGPKLLRPGRLLRFSLGEGGLVFDGGRPVGADLRYEGPANQRRGRADALSKVLFQALARASEAPGLEQLQAAAAAAGCSCRSSGGGDDAAVPAGMATDPPA